MTPAAMLVLGLIAMLVVATLFCAHAAPPRPHGDTKAAKRWEKATGILYWSTFVAFGLYLYLRMSASP